MSCLSVLWFVERTRKNGGIYVLLMHSCVLVLLLMLVLVLVSVDTGAITDAHLGTLVSTHPHLWIWVIPPSCHIDYYCSDSPTMTRGTVSPVPNLQWKLILDMSRGRDHGHDH